MEITTVESQVAAWLAEGRSVRDIAVATGRKESSVRRNIRQIYRKQGITKQGITPHVELIRRVLSISRGYKPAD